MKGGVLSKGLFFIILLILLFLLLVLFYMEATKIIKGMLT